eukprot:SAG31_NODE_17507_length_668_cov_0.978910_1_plen_101_part_00
MADPWTVANYSQHFTILPKEDMLDLRCLVDFNSVECFAMQGWGVVSLSVVPACTESVWAQDKCQAGQSQSGVSVSTTTGLHLTDVVVYEMGCGWVSSLES